MSKVGRLKRPRVFLLRRKNFLCFSLESERSFFLFVCFILLCFVFAIAGYYSVLQQRERVRVLEVPAHLPTDAALGERPWRGPL